MKNRMVVLYILCMISMFTIWNYEEVAAQTYTLGTATTASTNAGLVPINTTLEKTKSQYLIRASELTNLGAASGLITALALYVTEQPGRDMNNFNINIGTTADNSLTNTYATGLSNVYNANPQPRTQLTAGGWRTFTFATPFLWDGSSNILIEFCWDNGNQWTFGGGVRVYEPFLSPTYSSRWNTLSSAGGCGYVGNAGQVSWYRPNMQLTIAGCTSTFYTITQSVCDSYVLNGQIYTASGIYTQTLTNTAGCDSIITLNLTVQNNDSTLHITACNSYVFNGNILVSSGMYQATFTNAANCDSVVTLHLTIGNNDSTLSLIACDSYIFNGNILTASNTYIETFVNASGCDSVVTLYLTINNSSDTTLNITACNGYYFDGNLLTSSGTYTATYNNAVGCDSMVTLNLFLNHADIVNIADTACISYIFNGNVLTATGRYSVMLANSAGCDSIVFLDLFIPADSFTVNHIACDSFVFNGNTLTSSGVYHAMLVSSLGCDSAVTLNLTVVDIDTAVTVSGNTLTANEAGAAYQWFDCDANQPIANETNRTFIATANGNYAVEITENNCTAMSACYNVTGVAVLEEKNIFAVHPNPVLNIVMIEGNINQARVRIFSLTGKQIDLPVSNNINQIVADLSQLSAGMYIMEITVGYEVFRHKLIKR